MTLKNSDDAFLVCGIDFKLSLLSKTPHYQANQQELASDYDRMVQHEKPTKNIWGDHEYHRSASFDRDEYDPHKDPKGYQTGSDWNEAGPNTHLKHNNPGEKEGYHKSRPGYNNMEHHSRQSQRYPDVNDRYMNTQDEQFESNDEENRYNEKFGNDGRFQNENNPNTNKNPHSTTTDLFQRNPSATIATTDGMISQEKLDENLHEVLSGYPTDSSEMNDTNNNKEEQDIPVGADSEKEDTSLEKEENIDQEVPEPNSQNNDNGERPTYELTHETSTSLISQKELAVIPIYTTVPIKSTLLQSSKTSQEQTVSEQKVNRKTTVHKNDKIATGKPTIHKNGRIRTVKPVIQQKTQESTEMHDTKHTYKTDVNQDTDRPEITVHNNNNGRSMPGIDTRYKTDKNVVTQQRMSVNSGPIDKGDFREDPKTVKKTNNSTNDKTIHDSRLRIFDSY
ncbi:serum response factor homolog B-like [Mytilus trossulus]|uniref:serum response factor homolog B-like n=1 Tax=Mytilus trossulus TaxID=6551 RepID=UPI003005BF01